MAEEKATKAAKAADKARKKEEKALAAGEKEARPQNRRLRRRLANQIAQTRLRRLK